MVRLAVGIRALGLCGLSSLQTTAPHNATRQSQTWKAKEILDGTNYRPTFVRHKSMWE
jgi:hypothetical protein